MPDKPRTKKKLARIWIVVHDGCDGELPSVDSGNPWVTKKGAVAAIKRMGWPKQLNYRVQRFDRGGE